MNARDPIESQILRHHADEEAASMREELIAGQAQELMEGEYHPLREENFAEALTEMNDENQSRLRAALCRGDDHAAGAILRAAILGYWQGIAHTVAARIVDKTGGPH